ncbi:MAG: chromosomal replication initiator protein DnaA [Muribaculaceae bacterium]|nr:chromosomal replication initiator protein DnaA [Muribaculaceae bacterium]MDE6541001.1 chromosomal replication initiator protein DnaA [Muribaculaceae bacterium]
MEKNHQQLWEECRQIIKDYLPPAQFDAWFRDVASQGFDGVSLTLMVPSAFFVEQLEERYLGLLGAAIRKVYGQGVKLYYHYNQVKDVPASAVNIRSAEPSPAILNSGAAAAGGNPFAAQPVGEIDPRLNPRYNFENYCCSFSNKVACSIGQTIANDPKIKTFNPLFIFGSTGVGKTHLVQAIGIRVKERNPAAKVLYVTARLFQSQYTTAEAKGTTNSFFHFYQSIDTLIVDDIQDFRDKPKTQNTFFHIFNHLHQNGKQIIMSSDCAPADMEGFEDRLLSRFRWGMSVKLENPDVELRRNVLVQKAEQDGLELPEEVIDYIAANVTDSIRELEGIVVSLIGRATVLGLDITLDLARTVVANAVRINRRQVNFEEIATAVCDHYGLESDAIFTKSRKREISDARQIVMFLAKKVLKMPLTAIGSRLDRTHATVLYACRNIEERLPLEKQLHDDIVAIEAELAAH